MDGEQVYSICRLCLLDNGGLTDIFAADSEACVADLIQDLVQLQVSKDDGYPNLICSSCLSKLNAFKEFRNQCHNSKITFDNVYTFIKRRERLKSPEKALFIKTEEVSEEETTTHSPVYNEMVDIQESNLQIAMVTHQEEPPGSFEEDGTMDAQQSFVKEEAKDFAISPFEMVQTSLEEPKQEQGNGPSAQYIHTKKGNRKLVHEGYAYVVDKRRGAQTYWRCDRRKCLGRMKTFNDAVAKAGEHKHNHPPDDARIVKMRFIQRIKQLAEETDEKPSDILQSIAQDFPEDIECLPKRETLNKIIQRQRVSIGRTQQ